MGKEQPTTLCAKNGFYGPRGNPKHQTTRKENVPSYPGKAGVTKPSLYPTKGNCIGTKTYFLQRTKRTQRNSIRLKDFSLWNNL
ncbi:hypothetical protein NPIL_690141 [Nephila pilipes]|uniref:Uncharacterized protein n=1 Tax=Nephila pilipes TaxID=299642 RepID=A0A8X6P5N0_NEPPI|nr:hypothetical protein NPIL_690141 [Nephila pilipes]